jgi:hypothetical protein
MFNRRTTRIEAHNPAELLIGRGRGESGDPPLEED